MSSIKPGKENVIMAVKNINDTDGFCLDTERRGLGTPATRAGIIEKLIKSGLIMRQKKVLVPTAKGMALVEVLPEEIKSPSMTADWEQKLKLIERGELAGSDFISGIEALVSGLVAGNTAPVPALVSLFASMQSASTDGIGGSQKAKAAAASGKEVGKCPRCGAGVTEAAKGFFCSSPACKFALWKDSRFWTAKGKTLTSKTAAALLKEGRVSFSDLKSERTGKSYAAVIILTDDGAKTDFKLEFPNKQNKGGMA